MDSVKVLVKMNTTQEGQVTGSWILAYEVLFSKMGQLKDVNRGKSLYRERLL